MRLTEAIDAIEACASVDALRDRLQAIVAAYGFAFFAFVDLGQPGSADPLVVATTDPAWDRDYRAYGFFHDDPVLPVVRRANRAFTWGDVRLPLRLGRRKPGAHRIMEAARDHGLKEGYVVPFHYVDEIGRLNSASCVLFWKDEIRLFRTVTRRTASELNILMIYWAQRAIVLAPQERLQRRRSVDDPIEPGLTDQERRVLGWASRGKTMGETASILSISTDTVESHSRSAMRKLGAVNKTQAVVKAIKAGLIDL